MLFTLVLTLKDGSVLALRHDADGYYTTFGDHICADRLKMDVIIAWVKRAMDLGNVEFLDVEKVEIRPCH